MTKLSKDKLVELLKERDSKIEELEKEISDQRQEIYDLNNYIEEINKDRMAYDHDYSYKANMQKEIDNLTIKNKHLEYRLEERSQDNIDARIKQHERTILDMVVK